MTRVRGIGSFRPMSIPAELQKVVRRFERAPKDLRVQALLQYSQRVPPLPERFSEDRESLEQVHECQSPFFLASEVDEEGRVHLFFDAPPESPTVRGFAGILYSGLKASAGRPCWTCRRTSTLRWDSTSWYHRSGFGAWQRFWRVFSAR